MTRPVAMACDLVALGVLVLALSAPSCERPDPEPPTPPVATGGAGTGGGASTGGKATGGATATGGDASGGAAPADDCARAEARLRELDCRRSGDGGPRWETPSGEPLAEVCRAREADGDPICPRCLAAISRCEDVDACRATTPGQCAPVP